MMRVSCGAGKGGSGRLPGKRRGLKPLNRALKGLGDGHCHSHSPLWSDHKDLQNNPGEKMGSDSVLIGSSCWICPAATLRGMTASVPTMPLQPPAASEREQRSSSEMAECHAAGRGLDRGPPYMATAPSPRDRGSA